MNYQELKLEELDRANKIHAPNFTSRHQAFAVLYEEYEESKEALEWVERKLNRIWKDHIRRRQRDRYLKEELDELDSIVLNLCEETIQIGAMVEKFKGMLSDD